MVPFLKSYQKCVVSFVSPQCLVASVLCSLSFSVDCYNAYIWSYTKLCCISSFEDNK